MTLLMAVIVIAVLSVVLALLGDKGSVKAIAWILASLVVGTIGYCL
jgi:hypothetical protein